MLLHHAGNDFTEALQFVWALINGEVSKSNLQILTTPAGHHVPVLILKDDVDAIVPVSCIRLVHLGLLLVKVLVR